MLEAMQIAFWATSKQIVTEILVEVIALVLVMALIFTALGLGARR